MYILKGHLNKEVASLFKTVKLQQQYLLYCWLKTELSIQVNSAAAFREKNRIKIKKDSKVISEVLLCCYLINITECQLKIMTADYEKAVIKAGKIYIIIYYSLLNIVSGCISEFSQIYMRYVIFQLKSDIITDEEVLTFCFNFRQHLCSEVKVI